MTAGPPPPLQGEGSEGDGREERKGKGRTEGKDRGGREGGEEWGVGSGGALDMDPLETSSGSAPGWTSL